MKKLLTLIVPAALLAVVVGFALARSKPVLPPWVQFPTPTPGPVPTTAITTDTIGATADAPTTVLVTAEVTEVGINLTAGTRKYHLVWHGPARVRIVHLHGELGSWDQLLS